MNIKTKDGIILRNIPDGTPEEEIKSRINSIRSQRGEARIQQELEAKTPQSEGRMKAFDTPYKNEMFNQLGEIGGGYHAEAFGGTVGGRAAIGATKAIGKPVLFATRMAEELLGVDIDSKHSTSSLISGFLSDLDKLRDRGMVRQGIGGKIDIAGTGAEVAIPVGVMAKANIIKRLSGMGKMGKSAAKLADKHPIATGSVEGAGFGAVLGATEYQPEEGEKFDWEKAKDHAKTTAAIGGVAAPVSLGVAKGYKAAKRAIKHPLTSNPNKLVRKVSGKDDKAMDDIIDTLKNPEFESKVPGVKRTAGQKIAANKNINAPQIPAIEDLAEGVAPKAMWKFKQEQAAARLKEMHKLSKKDPNAVEKAKSVRKMFTAPLYKKAEQSSQRVDTKPVVKEINKILKLHSNEKSIANPLNDVLSSVKDVNKVSVPEMMSLSRGIKEMMKAETVTGKPAFNNAMLSKVKDTLDKQIGAVSPEFKQATELYKKHSVPVEQITVGKKLLAKLTDANEIEKRGASFAAEIEKLKTKRAYGKPLWDSLTKKQQKSMENILADLHVNAEYALQSRAALSSTGEEAASKGIGPIGAFKPLLSALRSRIDSKMGEITRRGMKELSTLMQDPKAQADMLMKGTPEQKAAMNKILYRWVSTPGLVFGVKEASEKEDK